MTEKTTAPARDWDRRAEAPAPWRGDHPRGVTPLHHLWLKHPHERGARICKWCGLVQTAAEQEQT